MHLSAAHPTSFDSIRSFTVSSSVRIATYFLTLWLIAGVAQLVIDEVRRETVSACATGKVVKQ